MRAALRYPESIDLSYFNARIRGARGMLMRPAGYEPLISAATVEELATRLKETPYGPDVEAASASHPGAEGRIAAAVQANLGAAFEGLWAMAPEGARPLLKAVFSSWEVFDLKALIRAYARGVKRDTLARTLIPAGEFGTPALNMLLSARDIPDLVRFLETWGSPYAAPLKANLERFQRDGRLYEMEAALDRQSNRDMAAVLSRGGLDARILRKWLAFKSDLQNMLTLVKISGEGLSPEAAEALFIEGGERLRRAQFLAFSKTDDRGAMLDKLMAAAGEPAIMEAITAHREGRGAGLEEGFEQLMQRHLARLAVVDPLSIALAASYIYMKVRETRNLMAITRGKAFSMPEDEIRNLIIYPV